MLTVHKQATESLKTLTEQTLLGANLWYTCSWAWALAGRYFEAERNMRHRLAIAREHSDVGQVSWVAMNLGVLLTMQDRYSEATDCFVESLGIVQALGEAYQEDVSNIEGWWGVLSTRQGRWDDAAQRLTHSLAIRERLGLNSSIPEVLVWFGQLHETQHGWDIALNWYKQSLEMKWTERRNFECAALTGLVRVKYAQGDYAAIPPLLAEAEQLAQQYEYNDHLASLRLTQGHLAWDGRGEAFPQGVLSGNSTTNEGNALPPNGALGNASPLRYFQHAIIYALRYNRFLLDEALSGRPQGTPLRPIIPYCLERGEEGRQMLTALRDWWQTGVNDIGTPRPDTISPVPEGIALLEAERIAREREPGDSSPQKSVVEQIECALASVGNKY